MTKKNACINALALTLCIFGSSVADVPLPIQVISGDEIGELPDQSEERILITGSRVGLRRQPRGITIRGSNDGSNIAGGRVLVNGVEVLGNGDAGATHVDTDVGLIPIEFIDRIEVLKGPAASLYGVAAKAPVVNVVTNDSYRGFDVRGSWVLNDLQLALGSSWFSLQSKEQCDVTNGALQPSWSFFSKHNYGLPGFSSDGGTLFFGSTDNGFQPGPFFIPPFSEQVGSLDFFGLPQSTTFNVMDRLIGRINNDPAFSDQDKRDFLAGMALVAGMGGPHAFSDQAYELGQFDPDQILQDLRNSVLDRSTDPVPGAGAAAESAASGAASNGAAAADTQSPAPGATTTESGDRGAASRTPDGNETGGATQAAAGIAQPGPFERFPYPPDYAFDFTQCTDEQRQTVLRLIRERDQARADFIYYMDYLRRDGQTSDQVDEDHNNVQDALETRDKKNEELRKFWQRCLSPDESRPIQAAQPATPSSEATDQTQPRLGYGTFDRWNLEFHVERHARGEDDSIITEPVPDLGIGIHPFKYDLQFRIPFSIGAIRDTELDAGADSSRTFTDRNGIGRLALSTDFLPFVAPPETLDFGSHKAPISGRQSFHIRHSFSGRAPIITPLEDPFEAQADSPVGGASIFSDWQLKLRYGGPDDGGPILGLRFTYEKVDSVVQEFPGLGGPGMNFGALHADILNGIPLDFKERAGNGFSIRNNFYVPYTFAEYRKLNLDFLDKVPGQSGWTNNFCGDAALPPEGVGYLTAAASPVKSVDDRWALEHVGATGAAALLDDDAEAVIVGIVDTGIDWNHLDFAWENLWRNQGEIPDNGKDDDNNGFVDDIIGWNFTGDNNKPWDNDGHGTFVAGIIAATRGNDAGIDGINPKARIMVLKALNNFGRTRASYIAQAIVYGADNGARILNLSISGPGFPKVVQEAVDYAESKGVLVIMAAGNRAESIDNAQPARLRRVMAVAATGPDDKRAAFSNIGTAINIAAPGIDVVSLRARRSDFLHNSAETSYIRGDAFLGDDNRYYRSTGTSFATPIVSGVASLVWAARPELSHQQVQRILEQSARDVEMPGRDQFTGYGIVDAKAAMEADPEFYIHAVVPSVQLIEANYNVFVQVIGVADANQFAAARIQIGEGENPESWTEAGTLQTGVRFGELARIPAAQLGGAAAWTVRLVVEHANGRKREARYVIDLE